MSIERRNFLKAAAALSLAAAFQPLNLSAFTMRNNYSDEKEKFKKAEQALLKKYHITAHSKYVKLSNPPLSVRILEAGKGDPVIMLHGGGAYASQFAPLIGSLQNNFHLYAPDRPGCGLTGMFNYTGVPFREHAINFVNGVMDSLSLNKAALIGNSMGGYWALLFALAHPEKVSKLILIGEPAGSPAPGTFPLAPPAIKNPSIEAIKGLYKYMLVADINNVPPEMFEVELAADKIPGADIGWDTMVDQFRIHKNLGTYGLRPELKDLKPPTLFIWGEQEIAPPSLGKEMAALAPDAKCVVVPGARHLVWLDKLNECSDLVIDFLK